MPAKYFGVVIKAYTEYLGSLAKPDPSAKREGLVASQYGVLYGRNAIIT